MERTGKFLSRRRWLGLGMAAGVGLTLGEGNLTAQGQAVFGLPFAAPPGPDTWFVRQWYGNTRWAYRQRRALYGQGQGLHFGVDFFSPCGTPIVAIGDGSVLAIDGPYGAPPHNVLVRHANGLVSLYGHLQQRSDFLRIGQSVRQGERVGLVGAPTGADCDTRPHVHLEIRESNLGGTRNPVRLIAADWPSLSLGQEAEGLQFQLNLAEPTRWQTIYDQPNVQFGGPLLNEYGRSWP